MAKQTGIVSISGSMGNMTFTKSGKRNGVQEKTVVPADRINSEKFERVRENADEFATAAYASDVIRSAFHSILANFRDQKMARRLHSLMMQIIKADAINDRGERSVADGPVQLLEGFQFNEKVIFEKAFTLPVASTINRVSGEIKLDFPAFIPKFQVQTAPGSTHYKFISAAAELDFDKAESNVSFKDSALIPLDGTEVAAQSIVHNLTANSTKDFIVLLGIQYYQVIGNGRAYPFKSSAFNSLAIIKVDPRV